MDISKNIFSIRESKGIKQYEVAEKLGIEPPNYSRLEKRGDKLTIEQLKKISEALQVSVYDLLGIENGEQTEKNNLLEVQIRELKKKYFDLHIENEATKGVLKAQAMIYNPIISKITGIDTNIEQNALNAVSLISEKARNGNDYEEGLEVFFNTILNTISKK